MCTSYSALHAYPAVGSSRRYKGLIAELHRIIRGRASSAARGDVSVSEEGSDKRLAIFEGEARIGEVMQGLQAIQLRPEDFASPVALQMALSRIYEAVLKAFESGPKKRYIAEIRFTDSLGNPVTFAVDLGETPPPFSKNKVRARIVVEIYEDDEE